MMTSPGNRHAQAGLPGWPGEAPASGRGRRRPESTHEASADPARRRVVRALAVAAGAAAASGCVRADGGQDWLAATRTVERVQGAFGPLAVLERGRFRMLAYHDGQTSYESVMDTRQPQQLAAPYTRLMTLAAAYAEPFSRAAQIGVGAGRTAGYLVRTFGSLELDAVDIDAAAIELGRRHFGLRDDARLHVHIADARVFLAAQPAGRYDAVLLDAYDDQSIPAALATPEFYRLVRTRLRDGGVAMQNVLRSQAEASRVAQAMRAAFGAIDAYGAGGNLVLAAHDGRLTVDQLAERARRLDERHGPAHALAGLLEQRVALY